MERVKKALLQVGMEVPLCIYMLTTYLKSPVFQNLIYEKLCLQRYNDMEFCSNISAYYDDKELQTQASHFYSISSYTLTLPSLFSTLLLGVASDYWSVKVPLLIPFFGLVLNTVNYVIQSVYIHANVYLLLISDAIFGVCGGYISIISTTMSYGVKTTRRTRRSYRIAGMEGAIGFGGTVGYALSGTIRAAFGYAWAFVLMLFLQVLAFFYIVIVAKENVREQEPEEESLGATQVVKTKLKIVFYDFFRMLTIPRYTRALIFLNLFALGLELLIFSGLGDIQYSYLRYKLAWGDKQYGWFSGLSFGITTLAVLTLYPFLRFRGISDALLSCLGMCTKIVSLIMMALVSSPAMAYSIAAVTMLNRFVSSGFRAFLSSLIETEEQGKMFSLIALLEGVTSLIATAIYNNVYPMTLDFFPGLLYVVSAALLLPSILILCYSDRVMKMSVNNNEENQGGSDIHEENQE